MTWTAANISVKFGTSTALDRVDLTIEPGVIHAIIGGVEHDQEGLRRKLEMDFDAWSNQPAISVSLREAPEPISHPLGFIVETGLQIDPGSGGSEVQTQLIEIILVFCKDSDGSWRISGLCLLEELEGLE